MSQSWSLDDGGVRGCYQWENQGLKSSKQPAMHTQLVGIEFSFAELVYFQTPEILLRDARRSAELGGADITIETYPQVDLMTRHQSFANPRDF